MRDGCNAATSGSGDCSRQPQRERPTAALATGGVDATTMLVAMSTGSRGQRARNPARGSGPTARGGGVPSRSHSRWMRTATRRESYLGPGVGGRQDRLGRAAANAPSSRSCCRSQWFTGTSAGIGSSAIMIRSSPFARHRHARGHAGRQGLRQRCAGLRPRDHGDAGHMAGAHARPAKGRQHRRCEPRVGIRRRRS
jgi:hypothetical protein